MRKLFTIACILYLFVVLLGCRNDPQELIAQEVNFEAADGQSVVGYLSKPEGDSKFPAIILLHGGTSSRQATYDLGSGKHAQTFIENGYVTLSVDYRESEFGGKEIDDVDAGISYLKTLSYVDSNKIGLFGSSHGAYMSLMTSAKVGYQIKAVIDNFGFTNLITQYNNVVIDEKTCHSEEDIQELIEMGDTYFGGSPDESQMYEERSPVYNVDSMEAPILIIHGENDCSVLIEQAYEFKDALEVTGKTYEIKTYENGPHGFIYQNTEEAKDAGQTTLDFLDKYLK